MFEIVVVRRDIRFQRQAKVPCTHVRNAYAMGHTESLMSSSALSFISENELCLSAIKVSDS